MVTTLYLIRHGETEGAEIKRYKGNLDVPLSKNGIEQIAKVSKFIGPNTLNVIYTSNLSRALKSAEIIAKNQTVKPIIVPQLRERNFGAWEGMTFDEIKEKYPKEFEQWAQNPLKFSPVGGESTLEVKERALPVIESILHKHQEKKIAIVSHGGIIRLALCHFLGTPLENIFRIEQNFAAVNIIEFWDNYPVVKLINGVVHG